MNNVYKPGTHETNILARSNKEKTHQMQASSNKNTNQIQLTIFELQLVCQPSHGGKKTIYVNLLQRLEANPRAKLQIYVYIHIYIYLAAPSKNHE